MKIKNNKEIAILMATYNGGKYLREQIDSLINQTFTDWMLYIQDDGSKDDTLEIIRSYSDPRIICVDVGLTRQGSGMNFMTLLNMVESDYYMFCDQDDVWFKDKIEKSYSRMKEEEQQHSSNTPIIVHTSRTFTDADLNVTLESEFNPNRRSDEVVKKKINALKHPTILAIYTIVGGGCTMMLNHQVKKLVFPYIHVRIHDSFCAIAVANAGGIISSIMEPTMYYRLHGNNTCGVDKSSLFKKILYLSDSYKRNIRGYYMWKIYNTGGGGIIKFMYYRIKYFLLLRLY
ncbi:glycosyltransferase [Akkermansia sp. N21169]|uniref:glycosyltransferase n=1 Tax=Akkermansia sp. N21169 TaxID=3040765 RepID=UPI00244ECC16|nr:glycosyltransferase [Akkermansia sp. N21169]MDH3069551.1 glycosyltransferase [Akkermansia sp. N21169]